MKRLVALILAYLFLALAIIGVFVPGLPTVPFLLLTAWLAARSSKRLHNWLYAHPQFGGLLTDWERDGAVSRKSKITAVTMLAISWAIMVFTVGSFWVLVGVGLLFIAVATFLVSRPEPYS